MTLNTCSAHQRKRKLATNAILQVTVALSHGEKRGTSSEKSADGKRRRRGRRKGEERRQKKNIFGPHLHPNSPTYDDPHTQSRRKERRKGQRERRTLVSGPLSTRVRKELVDGKEEEKRQQKVKKIFLADFQTHPSDPPPYHTPYPLTRLIEPFDER